ncbi:MAG: FkbM family methyltransferase [Proteobacteria bacterium]|nr:FkbM family methyltransferase [Pseudomonadota bacterium]
MTVADLLITACTLKDIETWEVAAKSLVKYVDSRAYMVLVPHKYLDHFSRSTPGQIIVVSEDELIPSYFIGVIEKSLDSCSLQVTRAGWIFQQFLKIQAVLASQHDRIILWDSDTVPLKNIRFFDESSRARYFTGQEYHAPYFKMMSEILGIGKSINHSFVAQSLPLRRQWVVDMCREIEERTKVTDWKLGILKNFSNALGESPFSEYETIGSYALRRLEKSDQPLPQANSQQWLRNGYEIIGPARNLSLFTNSAMNNASFVSFERWSKPFALYSNSLTRTVPVGLGSKLSQRCWQLVSLGWHVATLNKIKIRSYINAIKSPLPILSHDLENEEDKVSRFLADFFMYAPLASVLQIGANDGVQNDPLRSFLPQHQGQIVLVEPLPYYHDILRRLYSSQVNVQVVNALVASNESDRNLYFIDPSLADEMDGDGPMNKWAHGQGSFSRETIVSWIQKNQFRGGRYRANIPSYIGSIKVARLKATTLPKLANQCHLDIIDLLVIDVQGAEMEVLSTIPSMSKLPRFIIYEDDSSLSAHDSNALSLLLDRLGYVFIAGSDNRLWGHVSLIPSSFS